MKDWIKIEDKQPKKREIVVARFEKILHKKIIHKEVDSYRGIIQFNTAEKSRLKYYLDDAYALNITEWQKYDSFDSLN